MLLSVVGADRRVPIWRLPERTAEKLDVLAKLEVRLLPLSAVTLRSEPELEFPE
jgi:hypothetical protein